MSPRLCRWCRAVPLTDIRASYCSRRCRQTAFRLRRRVALGEASSTPGRFAYLDPPYPGLSSKYYRDESTFAGEVDHRALIAETVAAGYTGWALSTSARALRDLLPLCPEGARVAAWTKPIGVPPATRGIHSTWEPVIVVGGRQRTPGVRDWLRAMPARHGGELMGRKPLAFAAWLFDLLGMAPGDELVDVFPGTGVVGRAWAELSSTPTADTSGAALADGCRRGTRATERDPSPSDRANVSPADAPDGSFGADGDRSPRAAHDASPGDPRNGSGAATSLEYSSDVSAVGTGDASLTPRGGRSPRYASRAGAP